MSEVHNVNVGSGFGGNDGQKAKLDYRKEVKKRKYTHEMKREMLEMIKSGASTCEIMHRFNCPKSTIRSLKKNKKILTASVNVFSRFSSSRTFSGTSQRNLLLVITEHYLHKQNSDSDQALPANQEEMVDDLTPSTSPPCNREVLSVSMTIEELLEEDKEQEEQQPTQENDVKPDEPTTRQLTELLTNIARLGELLEEYDTRPHPRNLMCPALDKGDDDGTTDDDIEVLGDLLVEELPQDFEGFDAEVRGGSSNQPSLPQNPSTSPVKHFTNSIKCQAKVKQSRTRQWPGDQSQPALLLELISMLRSPLHSIFGIPKEEDVSDDDQIRLLATYPTKPWIQVF
ncbi:putative CENP-B N-terminal DNA-binding domain-containing protein 1 [Homarus americanus]|uniref:Putative CENP-B N-terminal DNA-binding domain-containing protein 1 n=1 Tax=Homarus americanus TaxID=6706 RepID=A0A8J5JZ47_HOMAM|nr:putative CENP-B N-terminal DNA-binding domain-containing protein 1 [Homarus americanus]